MEVCMNAKQRKERRCAAGLTITDFAGADREDADYWASKTPQERWQELIRLRRMIHGKDTVSRRLQGFLEIAERGSSKVSRYRWVGGRQTRVP